ncbi:MAG: glycosyltransferase family 39 protein [Candidatus Omnitrophica bacterium]|nr:glycosyltransferase family 39 protein [Candidatus Omnitrophota bacterium]
MPKILNSFKKNLIILILLSLFVRIITFGSVELNGYDERAYNIFMQALHKDGISGIRDLVNSYPSDEFLSQGPLPFRILFYLLGALTCKVFGHCSLSNLAIISFFSGFGIIIAGFILFRKWFSPGVAFLSALLLITSPLAIALSRRALQDSFFTFIVILSILFFHRCLFRGKKADFYLLGLFVLLGLLTKESMILLYPCFGLIAIYYRENLSSKLLAKLFIFLIISPILYLLISACLAGGFDVYFKTYLQYLFMQNKIAYAIKYQSGGLLRYIIDFMLVSPFVFLFSIFGLVTFLLSRIAKSKADSAVIYLAGGFLVFSLLPIMNLRLVLFLDLFLRAFVILGVVFIARKIKIRRFSYTVIILLLLFLISADISQYFRLFIKSNIYDPVTIELMRGNGLIMK